jgi:elongation factor Ts
MSINMQAIKELRERTQAGMNDCKGALTEAEGDMEKAVEIILKKGLAKSAKRAGAVATEGEVRASVKADAREGTIVEVNSQTDFAARNDAFVKFVGDVLATAEKAAPGAAIDAEKLGDKTVGEVATELTAKIGEKIAVRRWEKVTVPSGKHGLVHSYVHLGGKIGVLLHLETSSAEAAKHADVLSFADNTAMQIAAMTPLVVRRDEVTDEMKAKQKDIFEGQLREDPKPKPEAAWPKIIEGKLNKWYSEIALTDQESVVTPGKKIDELRSEAAKAAGADLNIVRFVRFERGEGIEKKEDNFAAEVAKMADK